MLQILATAGYIFVQNQMQDFDAAPLKNEVVSAVEEQRITQGQQEIVQNYEAVGVTKTGQNGKQIDVLAQIQDDLKEKIKTPEPVTPPKLDVESLGLDKVDEIKPQKDVLIAKNLEEIKTPQEPKQEDLQDAGAEKKLLDKLKTLPAEVPEIKPALQAVNTTINKEVVTEKVFDEKSLEKRIQETKEEVVKTEESMLDRIKSFIKKPQETPIAQEKKTEPAPAELQTTEVTKENLVQQKSKTNIERQKRLARLEKERKKAEAERKRLYEKRLNTLREKFLIKVDQPQKNEQDTKETVKDEDHEELMVPNKKIPIKFISREELPPPLMLRSQDMDNRHHPIVLTDEDYVNILFETVQVGEPSYFNAAYPRVRNPNIMNKKGDTLLTYALLLQKQEVVASILSNGADPDMPNQLGHRPLNIAIEFDDLRMVAMLVEFGADAKYIDPLGRTYLMQAARVGSLPIVDFLITQGTPINVLNNDGNSALGIAYRYRKDIVAKYLLKKGAKTWMDNSYSGARQSLIKELENRWGTQQ